MELTWEPSCWTQLIWSELPEDWDELEWPGKRDAYEAAVERARPRWMYSHPDCRHDPVRWAEEMRRRKDGCLSETLRGAGQ